MQKTDGAGLRYGKLIGIFVAFMLMAAILIFQQGDKVGVGHASSLDLLDASQVAQGGHVAASGCLALYDSGQVASAGALEDVEAMFDQTSVEANLVDLAEQELPDLAGYEKVVLAVSDLSCLGQGASDLVAWVRDGGQLMMYLPPESNGFFRTFAQQFGVQEVGTSWYVTPGIRFTSDLMLGGRAHDFALTDPYESSLIVALSKDCTVHAVTADDRELPLIWEYPNGEGRVVFCNLGFTEKGVRGIYAQAFGLLGDAFAWPVIDGSAFYLDDFPSPVPGGSGEYIERDYNTSVSNFYTDVWWPDLTRLIKKYGIAFTGLVIEDYNDNVDAPFETNTDTSRFEYFAGELLRLGGELGVHGYNHIPLVDEGGLEGNDGYVTGTYEREYQGYHYWPSLADMLAALQELHDFCDGVFPGNDISVYVPPSNILSPTGRQALVEGAIGIRVIASIYFDSLQHIEWVQEFGVDDDGVVNTPRVISGGQIDNYMKLCALSELNLHFVNSHFMHPDDMLDPDRGAEEGWQSAYDNLNSYMDWLYGSAPQIRNLTGSEMGAAVQRWYDAAVTTESSDDALTLTLEGLHDEAYLFVRSHDALVCGEVEGGSVEQLDGSLYLVRATSANVRIPKEGA